MPDLIVVGQTGFSFVVVVALIALCLVVSAVVASW